MQRHPLEHSSFDHLPAGRPFHAALRMEEAGIRPACSASLDHQERDPDRNFKSAEHLRGSAFYQGEFASRWRLRVFFLGPGDAVAGVDVAATVRGGSQTSRGAGAPRRRLDLREGTVTFGVAIAPSVHFPRNPFTAGYDSEILDVW